MDIITSKKSRLRGRISDVLPARHPISQENRTEWRNERRAKILSNRGYRPENIEAMMQAKGNNIRGQQVRKWLNHKVNPKEMDSKSIHL